MIALEAEAAKPAEDRSDKVLENREGPVQRRVDVLTKASSRAGYLRLMDTAYSLVGFLLHIFFIRNQFIRNLGYVAPNPKKLLGLSALH